MSFDINELKDPIEVWKAVEGEAADLIALLRSDTPIYKVDREALADWLEGSLKPVQEGRGRPRKSDVQRWTLEWIIRDFYFGHDPQTEIGYAAFRYERLWRYVKKRGWNKTKAWTSDRLKEAIAERQEIDLETFMNYLKRSKPRRRKSPIFGPEATMIRRRAIARELRAAKQQSDTARK